jgi:hypothetical protein
MKKKPEEMKKVIASVQASMAAEGLVPSQQRDVLYVGLFSLV